jgi:hypothetical protein
MKPTDIAIKNLGPVALLRDKRLVPARFLASMEVDGFRVMLDVEVGRDDVPVCRRYAVEAPDDRAITGEVLTRSLPSLGRLLKAALEAAAQTVEYDRTRGVVASISIGGEQTVSAQMPGRAQGARRRRLTDDQLRRVAETYRRAVANDGFPKQAVAVEMHVSESTAGRYVMEARRRGFLGKAPGKGRAGEKEN